MFAVGSAWVSAFNRGAIAPAVGALPSLGRTQAEADGTVWAKVGGWGFVRFPVTGLPTAHLTDFDPEAVVVSNRGPEAAVLFIYSFPSVSLRQFIIQGFNLGRPGRGIAVGSASRVGEAWGSVAVDDLRRICV